MREVNQRLASLSKAEARVLAEYSFGAAVTQNIGQITIATFLSKLLGDKPDTVRRRLREFTYDAWDKRGRDRRQVDVRASFGPLLAWVLADWVDDEILLALDPTYLGDRFVILSISVIYRGSAIPVAWHVQRAHQTGSWHTIWVRLLNALTPVLTAQVAQGRTVWVLTDQGLQSQALFREIVQRGWQPLMRVRPDAKFRATGTTDWHLLRDLVQPGMAPRTVAGTCFKTDQLACTLLLRWEAAYPKPLLVITAVPADAVPIAHYGFRMWIENGFRDAKGGGFQLQHTKIRQPRRLARLWLVLAVATLYRIRYAEAHESRTAPPAAHQRPTLPGGLSLLRFGWLNFLADLIVLGQQRLSPLYAAVLHWRTVKPYPL
jgi:hypothetical protein